MKGFIESICVSKRKGMVKKRVYSVNMKADWGIIGDAHAGSWHRQVSLLAGESIDRMKQIIPDLAPGAFAENIVTRDMDLHRMEIGDRLLLAGVVLLEITQIGKECHKACAIKKQTGDCIMPREGVFARVLRGGKVQQGDTVEMIRTLRDDFTKTRGFSDRAPLSGKDTGLHFLPPDPV